MLQFRELEEKIGEKNILTIKKYASKNLENESIKNKIRISVCKLYLSLFFEEFKVGDDIKRILNETVISANPISGNFYLDKNIDRNARIRIFDTGLSVNCNQLFKTALLLNFKNIITKYPDLKLKFKSGRIISHTPPDLSHIPFQFKPQIILSGIGDKKIININKEYLKLPVYDLKGNNPLQTIDNINNQIWYNISNTADILTSRYYFKFYDYIDKLIHQNKSDNEKLSEIKNNINGYFLELINNAFTISELEGRNIVKEFGEIVVFIKEICNRKNIYIPISANNPVFDLVEQCDSEIKLISIKTRIDNSREGAATSVKEVFKLLSNFYPDIEEYNKINRSLFWKSINRIRLDCVDNIYLEDIKNILNYNFNKVEIPIEYLIKSYISTNKYFVNKDIDFNQSVYNDLLREVFYRNYQKYKTIELLNKYDLKYPIEFIVLHIKNNKIYDKTIKDLRTTNLKVEEKGYLIANKESKWQFMYEWGNIAIRPKE